MSESEDIDIDFLIDEVRKRPAIWDIASESYKNNFLKRRAWEELVLIFCDDTDSQEKKKNLGTLLQTKWKSLKDNFIRASKKGKSGSGTCKNNYIHFNRLLFLKGTTPGKERQSNFSNDNETVANNNENDNAEMPPPSRPTAKKVKPNLSDDKFIKVLEKSMEQRHMDFTEFAKKTQEVSDEDKLFCLSLVNEIKKILEYKRLRAKIDIYNLIAQYQQSSHSPLASNYSSENYWSSPQYSSSGYGYTTSGRDIGPATPSSVATSNEFTIRIIYRLLIKYSNK